MPNKQVKTRAILRVALVGICIFSMLFILSACAKEVGSVDLTTYKPEQQVTRLEQEDLRNKKEIFNHHQKLSMNKPKSEIKINHSIEETSIAVVGDIMFHNTQLFRAYDYNTKSFDFSNIFKYMEPYLMNNDLTFANLETTLYGPYGSETSVSDTNFYGYSGYPNFNTPDTVLEPFKSAGFDFLSTANNHCLDKGYEGMIRTIEQLDKAGIGHTGTFLSTQERKPYELIEANGISFAVVNYTYATNGLYLSDDEMDLINTLDLYRDDLLERLYADVEAANASEADFVICMLHYGNEYWKVEDERYQKPISLEVIKRGADIVFGGHPHTLEPIDIIYEVDEVTYEEPKIIIYSLGNFLSSQRNVSQYNAPTDLGVMFNIYFETIDQGNPVITGIGLLPTYTIWQQDVIASMPVSDDLSLLSDYQLDLDDYIYSSWDESRIAEAKSYVVDHLMQYVSDKNIVSHVYNDQGIYRFDLMNSKG